MNPIRTLCSLVCVLGGLAAAPMAFTAAPAAFATNVPPPGMGDPGTMPPPVHTVTVGGTPGWQITLIAIGAALLAAVLAVIADRMRAKRQRVTVSAT